MTKTSKKLYFEVMRIIAVILVIFNHLPGYTLYQISSGGKQWFYMFLTMITRINVPIFFMISGALLLGKNDSYQTLIQKRVTRYIILLLVFEGAFFCEFNYFLKGYEEFTLKRFVFGVFSGNLSGLGSYWFLYSYIGMLLMLPFMQRIAKTISKSDIKYLLIGHFILSSLIPMVNFVLTNTNIGKITLSSSFNVPFMNYKEFFYPFIGYYLEFYVDCKQLKGKHLAGLTFAALAGIFLSCFFTWYEGKITGTFTQNYVQLFDYLTAIVVFIVIKYLITVKVPEISEQLTGKVICFIGSLTLGIYLLDPFFKIWFYWQYETKTEPLLPTLFVSFGWILISFTLGSITTIILKKIPGIKALL